MFIQREAKLSNNRWSAISRGAALGIRISSRKARRHYGVAASVPFIKGVHPEKTRSLNPYTGEARCINAIKWFIEKVGIINRIPML